MKWIKLFVPMSPSFQYVPVLCSQCYRILESIKISKRLVKDVLKTLAGYKTKFFINKDLATFYSRNT